MLRFKMLVAVAFLFTATLVRAQGNSQAAIVQSLNNSLLQLYGQLLAANSSNGNSLHSQASQVISLRFAALQTLITQDPANALELAFDDNLLAGLKKTFPQSASLLESHGTWTGPVDYIILDDHTLANHRVDISMNSTDGALKLHFTEHEPSWFQCRDILTVSGVKLGEQVAAADGSVSSSVASAGCTLTGDQKTIVLRIEFPGIPLPAGASHTMLDNIYFQDAGRSVDGYWKEASYNQASASGVVVGPVVLDRVYTCDEYYAMRTAAINAADPLVDFTLYNRLMLVFPNPGSCGWAGLGTLGCSTLSSADGSFTASTSWNLATYMQSVDQGVQLATHEGGHNITLHHASSRAFTNATTLLPEILGPVGITGTLSEYGDKFSTMGSWNLGHYAAPHKVQLNWMTVGSTGRAKQVESNGTFTVQPFELGAATTQALKVRRGTGNNAWLWLEFRQAVGSYDTALYASAHAGATVHYQDSATGTHTHLLDFTPGGTWTDVTKKPGTGTFIDAYSNVSFSVDSADSSGMTVTVSYGPVPCVASNPSISISPASQSGQSGTALNYTVNVTNNDTSGCSSSTFDLTTAMPSGWSSSFSSSALNLAPGTSGSTTMTKTIPAAALPGSNTVNSTAARGANNAAATATANVIVAPVTSVNVPGTTYAIRSTVPITATVTSGGSPAAGASVLFTMTKANGSVTTKTITAGSNGVAVWNYRLGTKDPKGTWTVKARATHNGLTGADSNVDTFTVN